MAAVYGFRWYRRLGADDALAGWALVGSGVAAALSLALVAAAGIVLATEQGATLDLVPVVVGVLVITLAVGALFLYERPLAAVVRWSVRFSRRVTGRPRGDLEAQIDRLVGQVTVVRLNRGQVVTIVGWALANWLLDCSCFALSFLVVGAGIPWKALLLAYGAGQLAANLPITPGGLGAVEGSITIALAYFGGVHTAGIDAVFIYRLISFWLVLILGWAACGGLALGVRRGRWPRHALAAAVAMHPASTDAGPTEPAPPAGGADVRVVEGGAMRAGRGRGITPAGVADRRGRLGRPGVGRAPPRARRSATTSARPTAAATSPCRWRQPRSATTATCAASGWSTSAHSVATRRGCTGRRRRRRGRRSSMSVWSRTPATLTPTP